MRRLFAILIVCILGFIQARALSFNLDSVAEWGKFPRFCVDTYRWGDTFFNGYDTTYVVPAGYKFNVKATTESWIDGYNFFLPDKVRMSMLSDPSTSVGVRLTYLAVSAGYDKNISHLFGSSNNRAREQFTFGFNCSLFAFNMHFINNTVGTKIRSFGPPGHTIRPNIEFDGMKTKSFGFDTYYFFNHKRYSQAAAFSFSRIQIKSQGSWFAGVTYSSQNFNFDFSELPYYMKEALPDQWKENGYSYTANTKNLGLKVGYGYNKVLSKHWLLAISEAPVIGLKIGTINSNAKKSTTAIFNNQLRASITWNNRQWFAGAIGLFDSAIFYDKKTVFQNSVLSGSLCFGYRFNLW